MGIFFQLLWKNGQFWLVTIEFSIKEMPIYCFYRNAMHVQLPFVFLRVYWRILMAMKTLIFAKYPSSSKLPKNKIPFWNQSLQNITKVVKKQLNLSHCRNLKIIREIEIFLSFFAVFWRIFLLFPQIDRNLLCLSAMPMSKFDTYRVSHL